MAFVVVVVVVVFQCFPTPLIPSLPLHILSPNCRFHKMSPFILSDSASFNVSVFVMVIVIVVKKRSDVDEVRLGRLC